MRNPLHPSPSPDVGARPYLLLFSVEETTQLTSEEDWFTSPVQYRRCSDRLSFPLGVQKVGGRCPSNLLFKVDVRGSRLFSVVEMLHRRGLLLKTRRSLLEEVTVKNV